MDIKIARLHRLNGNSNVKAFIDLKIDDAIIVKGIRVVSGNNGLFISMPREKGKDDKWYETIRPLTKVARAEIQRLSLEEYNKQI